MDKLDIIKKTEKLGGKERRSALEHIMIKAHRLGCATEIGGGRAGGIKIRYGSIGYAIMDINTRGEVKLYVQPHPNKDAPEELSSTLNEFIKHDEELEPKNFPLHTYGNLEDTLENIAEDSLSSYLTKAVGLIRENYYRPHIH